MSKDILSPYADDGDSWREVSKAHPCPVCEKPNWCSVTGPEDDPEAAVCMRTPSDNQRANRGWLHRLKQSNWKPVRPSTSTQPPLTRVSRSNVDVDTPTFADSTETLAAWEGRLGKPSVVYRYENPQGEPVGLVARWDRPEGKTIRQASRQSNGCWAHKAMASPKPLYRLPQLQASSGMVFVVEGEKCADALTAIGLTATTWSGGSSAVGKADFSPLTGREVILLADNDAPGCKAMDTVTDKLSALQSQPTVRRVELPGLPEKGDVVDWIDANHGDAAEPETITENLLRLVEQSEAEALPMPDEPLRWQAFPVRCLPRPVRQLVTEGAKAIGCDESYILLPLLSALATAIGTTRCLQVKRGWMVLSILWTAIIGESGTSKTPAFNLAMGPLQKLQRKKLEDHAEADRQYAIDKNLYKKAFIKWEKGGKGEELPPLEPEPPQAVRYIVVDTTVEALAPLLQVNPRGLLVARDELNGWLQSFDRYAGKGGADSSQWLSMHSGGELVVDRKTGHPKTIYVPSASVSITGGIQPGILKQTLGKEHRESGMAARLLLANPPRKAKRWTEAEVDASTMREVESLFRKMLELQPGIDDEGQPYPIAIQLSPEAKAAWLDYYGQHAQEQADLTGDKAAAWSKLEETPARLALVMHLVRFAAGDLADDGSEDHTIGLATMQDAVTLTGWFKNEAMRVYARFEEDDGNRDRRRLVEWIERKGGAVTARETQQGCRWLKETGAAETALNKLVKGGFGEWHHASLGPKGGRPSRVFRLSTPSASTQPPETRDSEGFVDVDSEDAA